MDFFRGVFGLRSGQKRRFEEDQEVEYIIVVGRYFCHRISLFEDVIAVKEDITLSVLVSDIDVN